MLMKPSSIVASWAAPAWADSVRSDEDALIHSRELGTVRDLEGRDLSVKLVQRDDLGMSVDRTAMTRSPAYVHVVGVLPVSLDRGLELAAMLTTASLLVDRVPGESAARQDRLLAWTRRTFGPVGRACRRARWRGLSGRVVDR